MAKIVNKVKIDHSIVATINKFLRLNLSAKTAQISELNAATIKNIELITAICSSLPKLKASVSSFAIGVIILNKADEKKVNKINIFVELFFVIRITTLKYIFNSDYIKVLFKPLINKD